MAAAPHDVENAPFSGSPDFRPLGNAALLLHCLGAHPLPTIRHTSMEGAVAREQRKPAAIVAADVVGYSRLMGRDELGSKPIKSCAAMSGSGPIPDIGDVEQLGRDGPEADIVGFGPG